MKRIRVACVVFPRASTRRPVLEYAWDAVEALARADDLDVEVLVPLPAPTLRALANHGRLWRAAAAWPRDLDAVLRTLAPTPVLVRSVPLPSASIEAAAAAVAAHLLRRTPGARPQLLLGALLDEAGFAAAWAGRALGVPSIVSAHGGDVAALDGGGGRARRARRALAHATRVLSVSDALAARLTRCGVRSAVLPFAAWAERFPLAAARAPGPPRVLFAGRISRAKGVDVLLDALARMQRRDARLVLVGPASPDLDVPAERARLGLGDRVEVAGEMAQPALAAEYASASCVVLPSRSEGLGCVLVEALLSGRPVVASAVGGIPELVDERVGALVAPGDASALAAALDATLARGFDPQQLRAHVLPIVWEQIGPRLAAVARSVIAERA